jgi:hypothetical protein
MNMTRLLKLGYHYGTVETCGIDDPARFNKFYMLHGPHGGLFPLVGESTRDLWESIHDYDPSIAAELKKHKWKSRPTGVRIV